MKLFTFYTIDNKSILFPIKLDNDKFYEVIVFGTSSPPVIQHIYGSDFNETSFEELDHILKYRYGSLIELIFEGII